MEGLVTESPISTYLAAWDALRHRLARLAGDDLALGDSISEDPSAKVSAKVMGWAKEATRIGTELASALEVIDRLADDAGDTAVISVDAFATPEDDG
jgi:hypothetical protein